MMGDDKKLNEYVWKYAEQYTIKPWLKGYGNCIQDNPEYWNQPDVLLTDTTKATVEQAKQDPMAGWMGWEPSGMVDRIENLCRKYRVPSDARVLELGCGGGRQVFAWRAFSISRGLRLKLYGIDHAEGAIKVAQTRMPDVAFFCVGADDASRLNQIFTLGDFPVGFDIIYTLTCLQHNSAHKLRQIFQNVNWLLKEGGLFWLVNELTIDSEDYIGVHHPQVKMAPWVTDERGSHGTAAWWIGFIADNGFELLSYEKSSYVFRRI